MLPTITHLERIQTRGSKTKVWETSKATLLFGMSWCWVFSSYLVQIYFPPFILILVLGAWSVGTTSTCSIYFHILLCSAEGIPCRRSDHYCLEAASLILPSIHSFILPFILPSSVCLCLSTPHSTHPQFLGSSDSSHPFLIQATVVSPPDTACPDSRHFLSWFLFPHIKFSHYVIFKLFNLQVLHLVLADTPI